MTISVCTQTSPSGCHSGSCGQPTSAAISGNRALRSTPSSRPSAKPIDGRRAQQQQLLDLAPDALGRQVVERRCARQSALRAARPSSSSNRAANCRARSTRRLSSANVAASTIAQHARARGRRGRRTGRGTRPVSGSEAIALIGEIAAPRGLLDRHVRVAVHLEAAVAAADLRLAPRQRHVDAADLVDGEALADGVDAAEALEQAAQRRRPRGRTPRGRCPSSREPEQPVAHPAADDERAAARLADRPRDRSSAGAGQRLDRAGSLLEMIHQQGRSNLPAEARVSREHGYLAPRVCTLLGRNPPRAHAICPYPASAGSPARRAPPSSSRVRRVGPGPVAPAKSRGAAEGETPPDERQAVDVRRRERRGVFLVRRHAAHPSSRAGAPAPATRSTR